MEVATQLLNSALHAAKEKANQKKEKDKNDIARNKVVKKVTNNNVFMGSHQEVLDQIENEKIVDITPEHSSDSGIAKKSTCRNRMDRSMR